LKESPLFVGVAVGCGWQATVAYVNVGCYYGIGVPLGCILGFKFGLGVQVTIFIGPYESFTACYINKIYFPKKYYLFIYFLIFVKKLIKN